MDMDLKNTSDQPVAVLGGGSFGTAVANILAMNNKVLFYVRNKDTFEMMKTERRNHSVPIHDNIQPTNDPQETADKCSILFPVVSSSGFRELIKTMSDHLHPYHILIHGTKGLDVIEEVDHDSDSPLSRQQFCLLSLL